MIKIHNNLNIIVVLDDDFNLRLAFNRTFTIALLYNFDHSDIIFFIYLCNNIDSLHQQRI